MTLIIQCYTIFCVCCIVKQIIIYSKSCIGKSCFPESCIKKGKWWSITNSSYKNLCVSSTKLKRTMKGSLCYSESIYLKLKKSILQELWIFFACVYTKNMSTTSDLENRMSLVSCTSNAIIKWLQIFTFLYWMDWCILEAYLWKYLYVMDPFIHD